MKRAVLCALALVFAAGLIRARSEPANPVPPRPGPYDLQTCFELAVLQSETLGMREEDIRVAQARYWQAVGSVFPQVHVLAEQRLQNSTDRGGSGSSSSSGSGFSSNNGNSGNNFGNSPDSNNVRINVRQPIFSGFREFNAAGSGRADILARRFDKERARQLLYLDVADVFYQVLMYQEDLKLLGELGEALGERRGELNKRVKLGRSRAGESLAAQSDLAENFVAIEQTRGLLGASRELLAFLIGVPAEKITLKDDRALPGAQALEAYLIQTGERPDVLSAIQAEESQRRLLEEAKGEHYPTIAAEANYYVRQHPDFGNEWNVALTFDLPIFEGGVIEARVREHEALVRQSHLNLDELRRTADRDVRTAYNNFISSLAQAARLRESLRAQSENYEVQRHDYGLGISSNLDVLTALQMLETTKRRLSDAEMDAKVNLVRLHVAAGASRTIPTMEPEPKVSAEQNR
ncbi:MAG: TolC family protein [Verrucomicrobiae bacterium]|nr:TolC family protein [Verrucomicrobiae bacterium]